MDFNAMMNNPQFLMGMGLLSGNQGPTKGAAFSNAMGGALKGMQMAQLASIQRKKEEREQAEYEKQLADERYERLRAAVTLQNMPEMQQYFPAGATSVDEIFGLQKDMKDPEAVRKALWASSEAGKQTLASMGMDPESFMRANAASINMFENKSPRQLFFEKLPTGKVGVDDANAPGGFRAVDMVGVGESGDKAGKTSMIDTAIAALPAAQNQIFAGGDILNGEINRGVIFGKDATRYGVPAYLVDKFNLTKGGGSLGQLLELGMQAITRTETGAAMPPSEVDNTRQRFEPKIGDDDASIRQKFIAYNLFLQNAQSYLKEGFSSAKKADDFDFTRLFSDAAREMGTAQKPKTAADAITNPELRKVLGLDQ